MLQRVLIELSRLDESFSPGAAARYRRNLGDGVSLDASFSWDEALFLDLIALRRAPPPAEAMRRLGERLRALLSPMGWLRDEDRIQGALRAGDRVRVELVSSAPELYALPWELCAVGPAGLGLGEIPGVDLAVRWPGVRAPRPLPAERRLLFAWAGPVPAEAHRAALEASWVAPREERAEVGLAELRDTLAAAAMVRRPFTHLHLLAHGERAGEGFALALRDGALDALELQSLLAPYAETLELVVLSACVSGAQEATSALGSPGLAAHRGGAEGGLRAVVASRSPLSARGSAVMSAALYGALLSRSPDAAVSEARAALRAADLATDALSLQLFLAPAEDTPARNTIHNLPFPRNADFVGRDAELEALASALREPGPPLAISGMPGTGKTQLALELAHRTLRDHEAVLWVDADGEDITLSFAALAEDPLRLGLPEDKPAAERAALVRKALETADPRLLVFENVEHPEAVWPHLPRSGDCRVVLTTRRADLEGVRPFPIDVLPRAAALRLLIGDRALDEAERAAAEAACAELGDLALAVSVAARVMRQRRPSELLVRLRKDAAALLERAGADPRFGRAPGLPALYAQSFEQLDPAVPEDAAARVQLGIAAFYAPTCIPTDLLATAARLVLPEIDDWCAEDGLARLCDLGLAQRDQQGGLVLHRLTAAWAAAQADDAAREAALTAILARCQATAPEAMSLRALTPLRPHLERVCGDLGRSANPDRFLIPMRLAQLLHTRGDAAGARRVAEAALALDPGDRWEGTLRQQLGAVLHELGQFEASDANLRRALALLAAAHADPRNAEIAAVLHELGEIAIARGQYAEALRFFQETESILLEVRGDPEHPEVVAARIGLGEALTMAGDYGQARALLEAALAALRRHATPNPAPLASTLGALGRCRLMLGDAACARDAFTAALEAQAAVHGEGPHPNRAGLLNGLGCALLSGGQPDAARARLGESLAMWERLCGTRQHHAVAAALFELGRADRVAGDLGPARARVEEALAIWRAAFGGDSNASVAVGLLELGGLQLLSGDPAAARDTLQRCLEAWVGLLGSDQHPYPAAALLELGRAQRALGDLEGALRSIGRSHELRLAIFGPRHPDVVLGLLALARVLSALGRPDEALARLDEAEALAGQIYGGQISVASLSLLDTRGAVLLGRGDRAGARACFAAAMAQAAQLYGPGSAPERLAREAIAHIDGIC